MGELQKLAPYPSHPHGRPVFIQNHPTFATANDHDGMLGSMLIESMLGTAFLKAASEIYGSYAEELEKLDIGNIADCYSAYITDKERKKEDAQYTAAHGQGTLAKLSSKPIANQFNARSSQNNMSNLHRRHEIERSLAYYAKEYDRLESPSSYDTENMKHHVA